MTFLCTFHIIVRVFCECYDLCGRVVPLTNVRDVSVIELSMKAMIVMS